MFYASYRLSFYIISSGNSLFMENVEVKQEIKNSDDGKGILITNDAIEQISNLLKGQSDKKALRVGVRSGGCSGMSYTMDFIGTKEIIGGGFNFVNPNASQTCGCGSSFAV